MKNKRTAFGPRLSRIEGKCDLILSELLAMRQRVNRTDAIDSAIERMRRTSRMMREVAEEELKRVLATHGSGHDGKR